MNDIKKDYEFLKKHLTSKHTNARVDKLYRLLSNDKVPEWDKKMYKVLIRSYKKSLLYIMSQIEE